MNRTRLLVTLACLCLLTGCVKFNSKRGVEVAWQEPITNQFTVGKTTRGTVMKALGPPSQVISLRDETVLYYLFEKSRGEGMILIVYNRIDIDTNYDRAIFFFNDDDVLTEFSTHIKPVEDD
jgi:outer membrane protein assembly factor BamE (lipoprotein component of BamABCDE complex)